MASIPRVRHRTSPPVNGCRWCGFDAQDHAQRWVPVRKWHNHEQPTDAQRLARMLAARTARQAVA